MWLFSRDVCADGSEMEWAWTTRSWWRQQSRSTLVYVVADPKRSLLWIQALSYIRVVQCVFCVNNMIPTRLCDFSDYLERQIHDTVALVRVAFFKQWFDECQARNAPSNLVVAPWDCHSFSAWNHTRGPVMTVMYSNGKRLIMTIRLLNMDYSNSCNNFRPWNWTLQVCNLDQKGWHLYLR